MTLTTILLTLVVCFVAGAFAGIGTGFAGMSAATVIGPLLMTFLGVPAYQAVGIGLTSDVLASAISAFEYHKNGNLDIRSSAPLMISVLCTTVVGSLAASFLPEFAMGAIMQIGMAILGFNFLLRPNAGPLSILADRMEQGRVAKAIIGGIVVGFICGFVGAGGGMMLLFVLTTFLGYRMHTAVGTSVFIMSFIAFTGGVSHMVIGGVPNILAMVLCIIFTFAWAQISAKVANKSSAKTLSRIVGVILLITSIAVVLSHIFL